METYYYILRKSALAKRSEIKSPPTNTWNRRRRPAAIQKIASTSLSVYKTCQLSVSHVKNSFALPNFNFFTSGERVESVCYWRSVVETNRSQTNAHFISLLFIYIINCVLCILTELTKETSENEEIVGVFSYKISISCVQVDSTVRTTPTSAVERKWNQQL